MKRGKFLFGILDIVENFSIGMAEMLDAMTSGYSDSYAKLRGWKQAAPETRKFIKSFFKALREDLINYRNQKEAQQKIKQRLYETISRLKKDGLIIIEDKDDGDGFLLTEKGQKKKGQLKDQLFRFSHYQPELSDTLVIVAFDVPEKYSDRRYWLREALKFLGFKMLQKSLWLGKVKLPKEFISDLADKQLISYVEIFAVTKSGSIRHLA